MKAARRALYSIVIAAALAGFAGQVRTVDAAAAALTDAQVDATIAGLVASEKRASVKAALAEFQKKSTMQERRDLLSGVKSLDVQIPLKEMPAKTASAGKDPAAGAPSRFPPCRPHYGCKVRSVCTGTGASRECNVVVSCPDADIPCSDVIVK